MYCCWAANSFEICSLRASAKLCSAMVGSLLTPAKASLCGHRLEGARREPRFGTGRVVSRGRHVVRCVRVEDRGQVLDVAAARTELPLAATVGTDPVLIAEVVGGEQLVQRTEAGRLDVDHPRRPRL